MRAGWELWGGSPVLLRGLAGQEREKVHAFPGEEAARAARFLTGRTEMSELCRVCSGKPGRGLKQGSVGGNTHFQWGIDGAVRVGWEGGGQGEGALLGGERTHVGTRRGGSDGGGRGWVGLGARKEEEEAGRTCESMGPCWPS